MDSVSRHHHHSLPRTRPGRKRIDSTSQIKSVVPLSASKTLPLTAGSVSLSPAQPLTAYTGPVFVAECPTVYAHSLKLAALQVAPDAIQSPACQRRAHAISLGNSAFNKPSLAEISLESRQAICTSFPEVLRLLNDALRNVEWTYTQPPHHYAYRLSPDRYTALQAQLRALQSEVIQRRHVPAARAPLIPSWGKECATSAFHSANDFELLAVCFEAETESFLADLVGLRVRTSACARDGVAGTSRPSAKPEAARKRDTYQVAPSDEHPSVPTAIHESPSSSIRSANPMPAVVNFAANTAPASRAPPRRSWYVIPCRSPDASSSSSEDSPVQAPALTLARAHTAKTSSALPANPTATRERYTHGAIPPGQRLNIVKATQNQSSSVLSAVPKSENVDSAADSPPASRARPRSSCSPASPITSGAVALHSSSSQQYTHQPPATSNITSVDVADLSGLTALEWAIALKYDAVVHGLQKLGAADRAGMSPSPNNSQLLQLAVQHQYRGAVERMLLFGPKIDVRLISLCTDATIYQLLCDAGAQLDNTDGWGRTPLILTAMENRLAATKLLLGSKVRIDHRDTQGKTALHWAAETGSLEVLKELQPVDGQSSGLPDRERNTPIHLAAREQRILVVNYLLQNCTITVNAQTDRGWSPLYSAAHNGSFGCIPLLIKAGAVIDAKEMDKGWTPLHIATRYARTEAVKVLLENGANRASQDHSGEIPLHLACTKAIAQQLVTGHEKTVNTGNKRGSTLVHHAAVRNSDVLEVLLGLADAADGTDQDGRTPLHAALASSEPNIKCIKLLKSQGGKVDAQG
ncbi:hypothetical protein MKEN_00212300 [Mycena kentingensis (nom. inval.)]|nr:hypothetical protein MKEN_00212300 [Mycena kentingensis (nom. inval.)]